MTELGGATADWRTGGAVGPVETDVADGFCGMTVEGGMASPGAAAPASSCGAS